MDGGCTALLGNLFQCLAGLVTTKWFLHLTFFSAHCLLPSYDTSPGSRTSCQQLSKSPRYGKAAVRLPQNLLCSTLSKPSFPSLSSQGRHSSPWPLLNFFQLLFSSYRLDRQAPACTEAGAGSSPSAGLCSCPCWISWGSCWLIPPSPGLSAHYPALKTYWLQPPSWWYSALKSI